MRIVRHAHIHSPACIQTLTSSPSHPHAPLPSPLGGGKRAASSSAAGDPVIGQAVIPLLPFIRNAASANDVALAIQNEDEDGACVGVG